MFKLFCAILITIMTACVTPKASEQYAFPHSFYTVQAVHVRIQGKDLQLVAQVDHKPKELKVLFLDPLWQRPLVSLRGADKEHLQVQWFMEHGREMEAYMPHLFQSMQFIFSHPGALTGSSQDSEGNAYQLKGVKKIGLCVFPEEIVIEYPLGLNVRVVASQVSCE